VGLGCVVDDRPVGVFDSGLGGLTVLAEAMRSLPAERFVYLCVPDKVPLGGRPEREVAQIVEDAAEWLVVRGCKALLLASNSATTAAAHRLRWTLNVPVVAMEPALKPAIQTCAGPVGVMATSLTLNGKKFALLRNRWVDRTEVLCLACDPLVLMTEDPASWDTAVPAYLSEVLGPWKERGVSAVVLGCTHFVLVRPQIAAALPPDTLLVDGNAGTVRHLGALLASRGLQAAVPVDGELRAELYPASRRSVLDEVLGRLVNKESAEVQGGGGAREQTTGGLQ
jgi:glutamate racemase